MHDVIYIQSRWGVRTQFTFGHDALAYRISDSTGTYERSIEYGDIDPSRQSLASPRAHQPRVAITSLWMVSIAIAVALAVRHGEEARLLLILPMSVLQLLGGTTRLFEIPMTVIPAAGGSGSMRIIQDGQQERILWELVERKRLTIRSKLAVISLTGDLVQERAKFDWLLSQGYISEEEHTRAVAKITLAEGTLASGQLSN